MPTRKAVPVHNLKVTRRGTVRKRSLVWRWRRALYLAVLAVAVGAAGLIYVLGRVELPVDPRKAPVQDQTSFLCAADVQVNCNASNAMAQLHGSQDRELVTWAQIPPLLRHAVIATEDKDFFQHGGVDPAGIARAAVADMRGQGVRQGGSTITQQYVKQAYLTSEQTATRKIKEAVMAVKLEQQISKKEILTRYLNTVYFGRGAYGVQAASRAWFGHDVQALNPGEAAFLAGLLRNPNGADPYRGPTATQEAERRRMVSLQRMAEEGYLTIAQQKQYDAVPVDPAANPADPFVKPAPKLGTLAQVKGSEWGSDYFVEHVRKWLVKEFGSDKVYGGGLKVYTTLDLDMQKDAFEAVTSTLNQPFDPAAALVSINDQGQVKAMLGGTDFANHPVNLATGRQGGGSGRQPGSTFKAFALAEAVREGYSVQSVLRSPTSIEITTPVCQQGTTWPVNGGPGGSASLVTATKKSINTVYAQLMAQLGPEKVIDMAHELGVRADIEPECAVVLGSGEVSVLDMAAAYSTFANQGLRKDPVVVTRVEFPDGTVKNFAPATKPVLYPDQAGRVRYALQQVINGGTGKAADIGRPAAGKTGTTQNNADSWFVGFTPTLTTAVWMGYPQGQIPMTNVHGIEVQGGTFPAEMWKKYMTAALSGVPSVDFPIIDPLVLTAGRPLDDRYGVSGTIEGSRPPRPPISIPSRRTSTTPTTRASGTRTRPSTTTTTTPRSTTPSSTRPRSTAPSTTAPRSSVATTTAPRSATTTTATSRSTTPTTAASRTATSTTSVPRSATSITTPRTTATLTSAPRTTATSTTTPRTTATPTSAPRTTATSTTTPRTTAPATAPLRPPTTTTP